MANSSARHVAAMSTSTTTTVGPRASDFPNFTRAYDAPPDRKWQIEVQERLLEYVKLPRGWDSYGALPVTWEAGMFALSVLNEVMRNRTPIPQVVPSSAGGVQLEWHEKGVDLELHVTAPYRCELWFQDHQDPTDAPTNLDLTDDYSALLKPIELLTNR